MRAAAAATDDRQVLVVDDESSLRRVLTDLLRLRGYDPLQAASGEEALELMATRPSAIAIIDIGLMDGGGEMDGIELTRRIKSRYATTECVILTGKPSQETAIDAVSAGAFCYLLKPFNVNELMSTLERALARWRENTELKRARSRVDSVEGAHRRLVARLRTDSLEPLEKLATLGHTVVAAKGLAEAHAAGREIEAEARGIATRIEAFAAELEAAYAPR